MSVATVRIQSVSNFKDANIGDIFSETQFYIVTGKNGNELELTPEAGESIIVDNKYVDAFLTSASSFSREEKMTRTDIQKEVLASSGVVMTINFNTKVDEKELFDEVMSNVRGATIADMEKAIRKGIKKGITGEERTIKGRHFGKLNSTGRIDFIDMEAKRDLSKDYDDRQRQVDPRTINWAIIKGVKYIVK